MYIISWFLFVGWAIVKSRVRRSQPIADFQAKIVNVLKSNDASSLDRINIIYKYVGTLDMPDVDDHFWCIILESLMTDYLHFKNIRTGQFKLNIDENDPFIDESNYESYKDALRVLVFKTLKSIKQQKSDIESEYINEVINNNEQVDASMIKKFGFRVLLNKQLQLHTGTLDYAAICRNFRGLGIVYIEVNNNYKVNYFCHPAHVALNPIWLVILGIDQLNEASMFNDEEGLAVSKFILHDNLSLIVKWIIIHIRYNMLKRTERKGNSTNTSSFHHNQNILLFLIKR